MSRKHLWDIAFFTTAVMLLTGSGRLWGQAPPEHKVDETPLAQSVSALPALPPWPLPVRCDFSQPQLQAAQVLAGDWQVKDHLLQQRNAAEISAVWVLPNPAVASCRIKARLRIEPTDRIGAEAGVIVQAENKDYYIICSLRRNKGEYVALLSRHGRGYDFGRMPGDMAPLPAGAEKDWHTIEVVVDGTHVQATVDEKIQLAFSFPLINGLPIRVSDQTRDIYLASNWGPEVFRMKGQVGLATRYADAQFQYLEVDNLPSGLTVRTPYNPSYDANGRVQPRWPYAWIMKHYSEWFLNSRNLVTSIGGGKEAAEADLDKVMAQTGWPPYFFTWATVTDDMGFDAPTQWPTHNGPPIISGYLQYYIFSGEKRFIEGSRQWADWVIERFSTPADFAFPSLPKSSYCYIDQSYETEMLATLELDKASYMALSYLDLYAVTGDARYLQTTQRIAETLRAHQHEDGSFPFRVSLKTGKVTQDYSCSQLWHAQFFTRLADLTGDDAYRAIGRRALQWLIDHPLKTGQWWGFYGDNPDAVAEKSFDQWVALETAQWLADHHDEDAQFIPAARRIMAYIEKTFFKMGGVHRGVPAIGEQTGWPAILPHHNMRLAETYARLYGATGDPNDKELALRISNSMTQMVMADGKFHHGLNSGIENRTAQVLSFNQQFSRIMAEIPEMAPPGENHLLYNSGYARNVNYAPTAVSYETPLPSQDILVVKSRPEKITVNGQTLAETKDKPSSRVRTAPAGWCFEDDTHRLIILHERGKVSVELLKN